jgi:hypothetical protein
MVCQSSQRIWEKLVTLKKHLVEEQSYNDYQVEVAIYLCSYRHISSFRHIDIVTDDHDCRYQYL